MNVATHIQPGYWWYPPGPAVKRTKSQDTVAKILRCVQENPGITTDKVADRVGTTLNYCRTALKRLTNCNKVRKSFEGRSVVTYWAVT